MYGCCGRLTWRSHHDQEGLQALGIVAPCTKPARYRSTNVVPLEVRRARRSAGQQLLGHPSSVTRPLRPVNLGPRDGAVEQHHKSASRRFRILHSRRRRPLAETLREPCSLTVSNGAGRVCRIGELAPRMLQRATAEVLRLRPLHYPVEKLERAL